MQQIRQLTDAEIRAAYGVSRDTWLQHWRELTPGAWAAWLRAAATQGWSNP